jgi:hypothetical protein
VCSIVVYSTHTVSILRTLHKLMNQVRIIIKLECFCFCFFHLTKTTLVRRSKVL